MGAFEKILLAQETILRTQNHPIVWLKKKGVRANTRTPSR